MTAERTERLTAVVTGAGAPPGVSIVKALRQSALRPRVVVTDADADSVGLFRGDAGYLLPRVREGVEPYLERLAEVCRREGASVICFGSEEELRCVAPHAERLAARAGATPIVNPPRHLEAFLDKWGTFVALRERALPVPDTVLAGDADALGAFLARHPFPVVLKPRHGSGSRGVWRVKDAEELAFLARHVPEPVVQELLLPDDEEYTVGVYQSPRTGYVGGIVLRRSLAAGVTYKAQVVFDPEIEAQCRRVVEAFDLWGPVNLQLRRTPAGIRIFEINLRFSSSAPMRAHFGFNEAELCLRDLVLGERLTAPALRPGWSLRHWDEVYVTDEAVARTRERGRVDGDRGVRLDDF